jgi:hypothetical protein
MLLPGAIVSVVTVRLNIQLCAVATLEMTGEQTIFNTI